MSTVYTERNSHDEWWQDTYICFDCGMEFMTEEQNYMRGYKDGKSDVLDKIRTEIKEWYWQADKQALAKDPCVVDAMIDLFIRTIDKYKAESEG